MPFQFTASLKSPSVSWLCYIFVHICLNADYLTIYMFVHSSFLYFIVRMCYLLCKWYFFNHNHILHNSMCNSLMQKTISLSGVVRLFNNSSPLQHIVSCLYILFIMFYLSGCEKAVVFMRTNFIRNNLKLYNYMCNIYRKKTSLSCVTLFDNSSPLHHTLH